MDGYSAYPQQRSYQQQNNGQDMLDMGMGYAMDDQSMENMVAQQNQQNNQNEKSDRRKSMSSYQNNMGMPFDSMDSRRVSMLDFGGQDGDGVDLDGFQFNPQTGVAMNGMMRGNTSYPNTQGEMGNSLSQADLAINTQFGNPHHQFSTMQGSGSTYASPLHPVSIDMGMNGPFANPLSMPMEMQDPGMSMMGSDMGMFSGNQFNSQMGNSPMGQDFMMPGGMPDSASDMHQLDAFRSAALSPPTNVRGGVPSRNSSNEQGTPLSRPNSAQLPTPTSIQPPRNVPTPDNQVAARPQHEVPIESFAQMSFPWRTPREGFPTTMKANPHVKTEFKDAYTGSGFDLLSVLTCVKTRPNPQIDIGAIDLSCAFVVCDANADDHPIVYCSDTFERLTGYVKEMIVGKNCRFLQSPEGYVQAGSKRKFCDDDSVNYLRHMIATQQEAQVSLINYRRGGQAFMNLLTMIPVAMEPGGPITYFVGFQVDIVEQPQSMQNKNTDGTYSMNYQRGITLPGYRFDTGVGRVPSEIGQTISKDEVSSVLASYGSSDSDISRRIWDKVLLENTDDVIHVLSLKGLFLYLSPSSNKVLEYDPSELIGTGLSSVCHPSDIVPVTRELKETTNGVSVNVVFRIRRKKSGYMWFEGHGSLHTEQGKGRKCIILVGRKRPVYTLSKQIVGASGGIGDNELWSKMSTSGMFLFVAGNVRQLLDRQPEELVGTSIQALMRPESKQNFGRTLEIARTGRKAEAKHEMINRRGQVLQAFTTIYPGDAVEGEKPTFIVAQTRLLKYSRAAHGQRPSMYASKEHTSGESRASVPSVQSESSSALRGTGANTPGTNGSENPYRAIDTTPVAYVGQNQYPIGHQDHSLASEDNVFDELKTTRSSSWQYELRQMEKRNRYLAEEVQSLLAAKKKRKRRKGAGQMQKDCANCHTRTTPEWRRGPSGNRDLCNSCGLRWAKQIGRVSPRTTSQASVSDKGKKTASTPGHPQPILPNVLSDKPTMVPSALGPGERRTPTQASTDSHATKVTRMEATAPRGYGGGIPARIEEDIEPE